MSLPAFQTTVVNGSGDILTAATVTVTVEATGAAAVLFSDRNGTFGLGSGGVFSVNGTTAFAQFFAASGEYRIEANDAVSGFSETWRYQVLSGTASLVDTGTGASNVPLNSDLGSASLVNTGLLTGNVPTANQLSMVGQTVNYTGANYQPEVVGGIGVVVLLQNNSGGNISVGASVAGSSLKNIFFNSSGVFGTTGTPAGTYKEVGDVGVISNLFTSLFVRTA